MQDYTNKQAAIYNSIARRCGLHTRNYNDLPMAYRRRIAIAYHKARRNHKSQAAYILAEISTFTITTNPA